MQQQFSHQGINHGEWEGAFVPPALLVLEDGVSKLDVQLEVGGSAEHFSSIMSASALLMCNSLIAGRILASLSHEIIGISIS